jgi:predicted PurR-regulated permease PerM
MVRMPAARRNRLILWAVLFLLVGGVIWAARGVLLPFVLGLVLAYLLFPVVNWLDRHMPARLHAWRVARPLAILLTYLLVLLLVAGIIAFFVPLVIDQVNILIENWPALTDRVGTWGTRGWGWYNSAVESLERFSPTWKDTIENSLKGLAAEVLTVAQEGVVATVRTMSSTISFIIGLVVIPFWLFYILHDESQVKEGVLGAIPALVVALLSEPRSAIWVAIAFFAIQQVENLVLVPRVAGESVKLHPALVMVVLVVGNELAGFWGMLIAVPVTGVIRDVFKYLYLRFLDEPLAPEEAMTSIRAGQDVQLGV